MNLWEPSEDCHCNLVGNGVGVTYGVIDLTQDVAVKPP